jgi:hypothetical protein
MVPDIRFISPSRTGLNRVFKQRRRFYDVGCKPGKHKRSISELIEVVAGLAITRLKRRFFAWVLVAFA